MTKSSDMREEARAIDHMVSALRSEFPPSKVQWAYFRETFVPALSRASERLLDEAIKLEGKADA